jgi:hypothetical protein
LYAVGEIDGQDGVDIVMRQHSGTLTAPIKTATLSSEGTFQVEDLQVMVKAFTNLARIEDVDLDGDLDIIFGTEYDGLNWQKNDGTGRFTSVQTLTASVMQDFTLGDLDADGDLDLAAVADDNYAADRSSVVWYRNETISSATGDFNSDNRLDATDIGLLCQAIRADEYDARYDLNGDKSLDTRDHEVLIDDVMDLEYGDANLDGRFDSSDLQKVFAAGRFELDEDATWETGDWNCDGRFDTADLVVAFQQGMYRRD